MGNMISSIGAVFMALGTIVLLFNVIKTTVSKEKAGRDPWDAAYIRMDNASTYTGIQF